jgi:NAD(P)-dependent dehydrogenase (short-subunit alcohol dehydrogenase family)
MSPYNLPTSAVWFITGCSSGIGQHLALYLASNTQSRIVATARKPTDLESLPTSPNMLKLALDVTSESSIRAALAATLEKWGRIDVVVNNAGYGLMADTETVVLEKARKMMDANFWGAVLITQLALPILRTTNAENGGQQGGVILQVTSMGGRIAFPGNAFYHASKFALEGFTEAIAKEMPDSWGISFCCVEPGGVKTNYAATSTADPMSSATHPAYLDPSSPTNLIRKYKENPNATKNWAQPETVAEIIYETVKKGVGASGELPLRLPLGADSWGMQKGALEKGLRELEKVKSTALRTSGEGGEAQLESLKFLTS